MNITDNVQIGTATILVNVGGGIPLVLIGTIDRNNHRHPNDPPSFILPPKKVIVGGNITEEEDFIVVDVTNSIIPTGFPLSKTDLQTDVAINTDYIIAILPVEVD